MELQELKVFDRIEFLESNHSYLIDGVPTNSPSVTQLLKQYKKEFDAVKAANRVAKRTNSTPEQVLAEWKINNLYSTTLGSILHQFIENVYNNKPQENLDGILPPNLEKAEKLKILENLPKLVSHFRQFKAEHDYLECIGSEIILGDIDDTRVCGTADMLVKNHKTNQLEILDFKTNKKMLKETSYGKLLYPFDKMSVGQINEYTIQLNTYKYFIEKYTSLKISKMKLLWFHVDNESYKIFELDDIQNEIERMFNHFKSKTLFSAA